MRSYQFIELLKQYIQSINSLESDLKMVDNDRLHEQTKSIRLDIQSLVIRLESSIYLLQNFISPHVDTNKVKWIEMQKLKVLTSAIK